MKVINLVLATILIGTVGGLCLSTVKWFFTGSAYILETQLAMDISTLAVNTEVLFRHPLAAGAASIVLAMLTATSTMNQQQNFSLALSAVAWLVMLVITVAATSWFTISVFTAITLALTYHSATTVWSVGRQF